MLRLSKRFFNRGFATYIQALPCNQFTAIDGHLSNNKYYFKHGNEQRRYLGTEENSVINENKPQELHRNSFKIRESNNDDNRSKAVRGHTDSYSEKSHQLTEGGLIERDSDHNQKTIDDIHARIRNCKKLQEVLDLQRECQEEIRIYQIPSYWNQIKLIITNDKSELLDVQRKDPGVVLKPLVQQTLDFNKELTDPRSMSTMIHAMATISSVTRKPISEELWKTLEQNISTEAEKSAAKFNSRHCANILWSFAKVNRKSDVLFNTLANSQIISQVGDSDAQHLANIVWAYAKVGHRAPILFHTISLQAIEKIDTFNSQNLANTVWAYARVRHPAPQLFDTISHQVIENIDTLNSQNMSNIVWAYAKVGHLAPQLFDAISLQGIEKVDTFNAQDISNTVWAYAKVGHSAPQLFDAVSHQAIENIHTFNSQGLVTIIWAYTEAGHSTPQLFDAVSHMTIKKLSTFSSRNLSTMVWAYSKVGHSAPELFDAISKCEKENLA